MKQTVWYEQKLAVVTPPAVDGAVYNENSKSVYFVINDAVLVNWVLCDSTKLI